MFEVVNTHVGSSEVMKDASSLDYSKNELRASKHQLLSDREFEILVGLGRGKALTEIAKGLHISVKTASTYRTRMMQKMGFENPAVLIEYVLSHLS